MNAFWTHTARAFRRTAPPLASYYAVTLAVPLANGAARSDGTFVEHALMVLVVPPIAILCACTVHAIGHAASGVLTRSLARLQGSEHRRPWGGTAPRQGALACRETSDPLHDEFSPFDRS